MLCELAIHDFALIDRLHLTFSEGLTVLTGETGAGKSIILDALGLALGDRASPKFIRQGSPAARVSAVFEGKTLESLRPFLQAKGLPIQDTLILRREMESSGKNRCYVNDEPTNVNTLAELGEHLVDIHGQHEHQSLLKTKEQLALLDSFGDLEGLREKVEKAYGQWKDLTKEQQERILSEKERAQKSDLYSYQWQEIESAKLSATEEEELEKILPQVKNQDKLNSYARTAYEALSTSERSLASRILSAKRELEKMSQWGSDQSPAIELLDSVLIPLEEVTRRLEKMLGHALDPQEIDRILGRLDKISKLKRKYGKNVPEILEYAKKIKSEWEALEHYEETSQDLLQRLQQAQQVLSEETKKLSKKRKEAAARLQKQVEEQARQLGLPHFRFQVEFVPLADGMENVEFLMAANPGEGLKPLRQIASGGEMSRVMLALKTVLAESDKIPILIFDEIDAGVGGPMGEVIGQKLKYLAGRRQILCVTHLAQIASCAHNHFHVSKSVAQGRTATSVTLLQGPSRVEEVARMLGGQKLTDAGRKHAEEMLFSA